MDGSTQGGLETEQAKFNSFIKRVLVAALLAVLLTCGVSIGILSDAVGHLNENATKNHQLFSSTNTKVSCLDNDVRDLLKNFEKQQSLKVPKPC